MTNYGKWTDYDDTRLCRLWRDTDDSVTAIALAMHRRQSSVRARAEALCLPPRERCGPRPLDWNDAQLAILRERFEAGDSFSQIAARIGAGCSKSAAIGKAARLGLERSATLNRSGAATRSATSKGPKVAKPTAPPKPRLAIHGNGKVVEVAKAPPPVLPLKRRAFEPLGGTSPKPWDERGADECTWPVGEGLSCCAPVQAHGWCFTHYRLGTTPLQSGKPRTGTELIRSVRRYV